jgi:hypothetical protein
VVLRRIGRRADTVLYRAERRVEGRLGGGTAIPATGAVLSATGSDAIAFVAEIARSGAVVKVVTRLGNWPNPPRAVVGGWPRVVTAGVNVGAKADSAEGSFHASPRGIPGAPASPGIRPPC